MLVRMRVWRLATLLTLGLGGLGPVATLYPGRGVIAVADASTCPSGWNCADIGSPSAGDQSLSAGAWTVQGLGQDITGSADQFHYVYQTVAGDSSLTVRLTSQTNTGVCAKAGIMYRADTSADAPDYDAVMTPNCAGTSNSIFIQYRTAQGGSTAAPAHLAVSLPVYLRIERVGNSFATYTSPDGNVWSIVAGSSASVSLPSTALAGIAVSSFNAATPSIATFDNVAINTQDYTTCPSDWACADIGTPALPGGQALSSGAWTVRGSGTDITGSADQFHYVYRTVVGDSSMIVRLTSQTNTGGCAKAGIMYRASTDAGAPAYDVVATPNCAGAANDVFVQYRTTQGGSTTATLYASRIPPVYLRIDRAGNTLSTFVSTDGTTWTLVANATVTLALPSAALVGMAVSSFNTDAVSTAIFDHVSINRIDDAECPSGWACSDVGTPSQAGGQRLDGGTYTVQGSGMDITGSADQFHYVYQTLAGDGGMTVRLTLQTNTGGCAKAGIMYRASTDPGAPDYDVVLAPSCAGANNGIFTQYRTTAGGSTTANLYTSRTPPVYLRVMRAGNTFTAYTSSDGAIWTAIGDSVATIPLPSAALVGMAVSSFNANAVSTATFDHVGFVTGPSAANVVADGNSNTNRTFCTRVIVPNTRDPVNCATGDFYNTTTDLAIPGRGIPLDVSRTYNSLSASQDSPLGYGWTGSYGGDYLSTDASGVITATEGNGSSVTFSPDGKGGYTAPSRVLATLTQNPDGTFALTRDKDQQRLVFTAPTTTTGLLIDQIDRNGYTTALTYTNGLLSKVTDPAGRSLTFTFSGNHISSVADPVGRTVAYTYDTAGNLIAVQDVGGNVARYGYDQGTHLLRTITDPNGNILTLNYDPLGRVTAVTDPLGHTATMTYTANADGSQTTTMTDTRGSVTQEQYLNNELLSETRGVGTKQQATWSYTYDPATLGVASETDPDGHTTYSTYDSRGNLTSHTDALGRTTTYTYDQLNDLTSVTDPLSVTTVMTYDANGNLLQTSRPLTQTGQVATTTLTYDPKQPGDVIAKTDPDGHTWHYAYDAYGDQTSATDPAGDTTPATFDLIGRKTSVTDPRGNVAGADPGSYTATMAYNALGQTTAITDPLGRVTTYQYDADQNLITTTDPLGRQTVYGYDGNNHRTSVTQPDGSLLTTGYDPAGNVITQTDALGNSTLTAHDPLGRVASVTDPLGRVTTYQDDLAGNVITTTDPLGHQTSYGYDAANEQTTVTQPDGGVITTTYDLDGRVSAVTDPLGHTTSYGYDSLGRLTSVTDPLSRTTTYSYDLAGNRAATTDALGRVTTYQYDAADRPITTTDALSGTTITGYDPAGEVITSTDALGRQTLYGYDADGEQTSLTRPDGAVLSTAYDADGNAITQTNAMGRATVSGYDRLNRLISVTDPRGATTTYQYDADGRDITTTNALDQQTVASYDAAGQQTGVTQADGSHLTTAYDADGNVITSTDALGHPTVYGYDAMGRVTSSTDPLGRTTSYRYDLDGNRAALTDPLSRTTTYGYDAADELTGIAYSDGQTPDVAYTYTATGQRASMTDGTGTTTYSYDALDRPITVTNGAGQTLGYGYDAVGNPTRLTYPDGSYVTRSYDTLDRLTGVTDWLGHATQFGYDRDSNLITATLPTTGGVTTIAQGYNAADQLTSIAAAQGSATLWSANDGRDLLGQVITSTDTLDPHTHSYAYSPLDQLIADQAVSGTAAITQTWSPNSAYELTARTDPSGAMAHAYGYDAASEVLTDTVGSATTTYSYDGNGNRISQQDGAVGSSAAYVYDQADRLTSAVISATAGITGASYTYDGDGLRQSKTITTTGGVTTTAEAWDTSGALPLLAQDGATKYLSGPDGLPLEQIDGSGHVAYYLHDQLGSTRLVLDGSGATVAIDTYDACGNLTAQTGTVSTPFGFAGEYTDAETGLQYLRARYYDPATAQFLSVDPLAAKTGQPYAYATDNPPNATDPTGLDCSLWALVTGGCRLPTSQEAQATWNNEVRPDLYGSAVQITGFCDAVAFGQCSNVARRAGADVPTCSSDYQFGNRVVGGVYNVALALGSLGADEAADVSAARVVGDGSGPWADEGANLHSGGAIAQTRAGSCVSACGAMLSGGTLTEDQLLSELGEWSNPRDLARSLNARGGGWQSGYFASGSDAVAAAERGPMGAVLQAPGGPAHMVVIESTGTGSFLVRDPSPGVTYEVTTEWIDKYVAGGVWR